MGPDATDLRRELKWLAATLGAVRDFDVQIQSLGHACHALQAEPEAAGPVVCLFKARRTTARAALVGALAAPRFAELVGALETLLEQPWPAPESQPDAPWLIGARYRRLRRAGEAVLEDARPKPCPKGAFGQNSCAIRSSASPTCTDSPPESSYARPSACRTCWVPSSRWTAASTRPRLSAGPARARRSGITSEWAWFSYVKARPGVEF